MSLYSTYSNRLNRINCRVPQTPRSPFAAASHYFDDIFSRTARPRGSRRPSVRRSSTSRSIGNRSDFESAFTGRSTPGPESALDDDEKLGESGLGLGDDEHVSQYLESQLERVRSRASMGAYEDEFEAQADRVPNGH